MHLIQILLPLYDNNGRAFPRHNHKKVQLELTQRFQGLTAYSRAPAEGLWTKGQSTKRDQIIVYEVMARSRHDIWWRRYRLRLEKRFRQESIVIRAHEITLL